MDRKSSVSSVEEFEASGGRDSGHGEAATVETSSSSVDSGGNKSSTSIECGDQGIDLRECVRKIEIQKMIGARPEFWMTVSLDDDFADWSDMR